MDENTNTPNTPETPDDRSFLMQQIEQLRADKDAMQQEFVNADVDTSPESIRTTAISYAPNALESINRLAQFADKDSDKIAAAKYLIDIALGIKLPAGTKDDVGLTKLLEQLQENDNK